MNIKAYNRAALATWLVFYFRFYLLMFSRCSGTSGMTGAGFVLYSSRLKLWVQKDCKENQLFPSTYIFFRGSRITVRWSIVGNTDAARFLKPAWSSISTENNFSWCRNTYSPRGSYYRKHIHLQNTTTHKSHTACSFHLYYMR